MSDFDVGLIVLAPLGLVLLGVALLWVAGYRALAQKPQGASWLPRATRIAGGMLFGLGLFLGVTNMVQLALGLLLLPVTGLALLAAMRRYDAAESRSLVWLLVSAAERGIPLDQVARDFAAHRDDRSGQRAEKLADFLEAGVPLGLALRRSGHRVDSALAMAADLGCQTGTLGTSLRWVAKRQEALEQVTETSGGQLVYLGVVIVHALAAQAFVVLNILPKFQQMMSEFGLRFPVLSDLLLSSAQPGEHAWFAWLTFAGCGLLIVFLATAFFLGVPWSKVPLIGRLLWRVESSVVVGWLATTVRRQRPILETLRLLASYFPQPRMRRALDRTARRIEQGHHWSESLARCGILRRRESDVLHAAERAGNLDWALDEISDGMLQSWAFHMRSLSALGFPMLLVAVGAAILLIAAGTLLPLLAMIASLS